MGTKKRLPSRQRPKDLTTNALIEVHLSLGAQPENASLRGDYSDTLLAVPMGSVGCIRVWWRK